MYTGHQSHYTERTMNTSESEWLYDRAKLMEEHFRPEDSVKEKDDLSEEARKLRLFSYKRIWTRRAATIVKSKRQGERKGWNSASGPKNDPMSSKMKMLLTCSKGYNP